MANKELNIMSPFKNLGTHVFGERFVGRIEEVKTLQENCTSRNFSIVGLPKIGKTSLAYHSIIEQNDRVSFNERLCSIFFNCGTCKKASDFFLGLMRKTKEEMTDVLSEDESKKLERLYRNVIDSGFDEYDILAFFESGLAKLSIDLVFVFDEFDKVRTIEFDGSDFSMLRAILSVPNVHGVIVSKRTIYAIENWENDSSSGPSTFYQLFQGNTIRLGQFDEVSMCSYWKRLESYGFEKDEDYKRLACSYAGNHPHLLDIFNSCIYDLERCGNIGNDDVKLKIRSEMSAAFDSTMEILRSEGLLDAAVQAIVGPVYNLTEEQLDKLIQYDFVRKVTAEEKIRLVGMRMGYSKVEKVNFEDIEYSYVATSDYFTLLMKNKFINKVSFWDGWVDTFKIMREIAGRFFQEKWGDDWETLGRDQDSIIRQMNILRKKDLDSNIEISPILEYLTETLLRKLFHKNWSSFAPFLTPMSKVDFFAKYDYLLKIRNHHAHANAKFLSEENRQQADKYLREIGDAVSNSYEKTFILIEEEDEIYEVMMYENSKGNQFKYCVYKGKNALFHPEALVEEGDEIILKVIPKENTTPNELIKNTYPLKILSGTYEKL